MNKKNDERIEIFQKMIRLFVVDAYGIYAASTVSANTCSVQCLPVVSLELPVP